MSGNKLELLIKSIIDQSSQAIKDLNIQIKTLSSKLDKLKLDIEIDDTKLKNLTEQLEKLGATSKGAVKESNKVFKTEIEYLDQLDGSIKKVIRSYKDNGEIVEKVKNITKKQMDEEKKHVESLKREWTDYGKVIRTVLNQNAEGETISAARTSRNKKGIETTEYFRAGETTAYKVVNNIERAEKEGLKLQNQIQQIHFQLDKLRTKYGDGIFNALKFTQIDPLRKKINNITTETDNWENELTQVKQRLKEIDAQMNRNKLLRNQDKKIQTFAKGYEQRLQQLKNNLFLDTSELNKFEKEIDKLSKKMHDAFSKGDTKAFDKYKNDVKQLGERYKEIVKLNKQQQQIQGKLAESQVKHRKETEKQAQAEAKVFNKLKEQEYLRQQKLGEVVKNVGKIDFDASDTELKRYAESVAGVGAEYTKITPKVDSFGNKIKEVNVRVREGKNHFRNYTMTLDQTTGQLYKVDKGLSDVTNKQLGMLKQFQIAMSRIPVWMAGMTAKLSPSINSVNCWNPLFAY